MYLVVFSHRAFGHLKHWFIKLKIYPEKYADGIVCIVSNFKRVNKIEGELVRELTRLPYQFQQKL